MTIVMALEFDVFKFFEFFGGRFAVAIIAATQAVVMLVLFVALEEIEASNRTFEWSSVAIVVTALEQDLRDVGVGDTVFVVAADQAMGFFVCLQSDVFQTNKVLKFSSTLQLIVLMFVAIAMAMVVTIAMTMVVIVSVFVDVVA